MPQADDQAEQRGQQNRQQIEIDIRQDTPPL
jgi:hypothetical protein